MAQEHFYQVAVQFETERKGTLSSEKLTETLEVATPPEFPKGMENIWSPEHYFVAAVNSCLMTTFLAIAENFKLPFVDFKSDATGTLSVVDGKYMMSKIVLRPTIVVENEEHRALAQKVIEKSEKACLITNSIKSDVLMEVHVVVSQPVI